LSNADGERKIFQGNGAVLFDQPSTEDFGDMPSLK
jgi:hypothetical protein